MHVTHKIEDYDEQKQYQKRDFNKKNETKEQEKYQHPKQKLELLNAMKEALAIENLLALATFL